MAKRGVHARLYDMLNAIQSIESMQARLSSDPSLSSVMALAMERAIEIISEASRHIPDDMKATAPDIPWRQIADIGNVLGMTTRPFDQPF